MHFSNCKGFLNDPYLEAAVTQDTMQTRLLGGNSSAHNLVIPMEIEFSISSNTGLTWSPDLNRRIRTIQLHRPDEDVNSDAYTVKDRHGWIRKHRVEILGAIHALVQKWIAAGRQSGPTTFNSFQVWGVTIGGIMDLHNLGNPCLPDSTQEANTGDTLTRDMKELFRIMHEKHQEKFVKKQNIYEVLENEEAEDLFPSKDIKETGDRSWFMKNLNCYVGRNLGGILLEASNKGSRHSKFCFRKQEKVEDRRIEVLNTVFTTSTGAEEPEELKKVTPMTGMTPFSELSSENIYCYIPTRYITKSDSGGDDPIYPADPVMGVKKGFELVSDIGRLEEIISQLSTSDSPLCCDLETYGQDALDERNNKIRLVTISADPASIFVVDVMKIEGGLCLLVPLLESRQLILHHAQFDLLCLKFKTNLNLQKVKIYDTMTAARILENGLGESCKLGDCLTRYLDVSLPKDQGTSDWGIPELASDQLNYAANDVRHLHQLKESLESHLEEAGLSYVANHIEMPLIPGLVNMEFRGVLVDREKLVLAQGELTKKVAELGNKVHSELKAAPSLNLNSPKQLKDAFAAIGIEVKSTKKDILANLTHPAASAILEFRCSEKRLQEVERMLKSIQLDDRVRAKFKPFGARTGRLSSSKPSIQNLARDGSVRAAFIPDPGSVFVVADYDRIELQVAAAIANEPEMLSAFRDGVDLHRKTASLILQRPIEEITNEERRLAKAVNFGILFGKKAKGLVELAKDSYGVEMSLEEAEEYRKSFFDTYPRIRAMHETAKRSARGGVKETRTLTGRRRLLNDDASWWTRFSGSLNAPVQGTAADGMKIAMNKLWKQLPDEAYIVSTIHDELIVSCPKDVVDSVKNLLNSCMVEGMEEAIGKERLQGSRVGAPPRVQESFVG